MTLTLPGVIDGRALDLEAGGFGVDGRGRAVVTVAYSLGLGKGWRTIAVRYRPDGELDPSYGRGGLARVGNVTVYPALVRRDGRLYALAGDDRRDTQVIALDARGRRVPGFRTRTLMSRRFANYLSPHSIIAGGGGRLLVAGGGLYRSGWVVQLAADGRADRRFGDRGLSAIPDFTANTIVRDRRGRVVVAGSTDRSRGPFQAAVARLSARGRLDRGFGDGGVVSKQLGTLRGVTLVASEARHVALDDRDRIVVAGEVYDDEYELRDDLGRSYPAIARLRG